jgi:Type VI secretion system (T6SS), amidase effector protein 4
MAIFRFRELWENHPTIKGDAPLLDKLTYKNQCAINVSAALTRTGVSMNDFHGALSWQKDKPQYAIRAQELADWLTFKSRFLGRTCVKISVRHFNQEISNQSGIIFFQNYWGTGRQGDHIDLWNGSRLTDWKSWARINLHLSWEGQFSNFYNAESIWFWGIS